MAVPTDTYQTYDMVGIRESLTDLIHDISPTQTPFLTSIKRGPKPKSTYHEWQIDVLAAPDGDNKVVQGSDATTTPSVPTTRPGNYTQIMEKVPRVSTTADSVDSAGRNSELAYQVAKMGKEMKRDQETRLMGNFPSAAGDGATVAAECAGYEAWLTTNTNRGTGGADGGFAAGVVSAATDAAGIDQRAFSEDDLKSVIASCWDAGGEPDTVMLGSFNKQVASGFQGIATLYRDTGTSMKQASIMAGADIYVSDFGEFRFVPNRFSRAQSAPVIDFDYWCINYLQPYSVENLAKTGHSERRLLSAEFTMESQNEAASGIVADLTTS